MNEDLEMPLASPRVVDFDDSVKINDRQLERKLQSNMVFERVILPDIELKIGSVSHRKSNASKIRTDSNNYSKLD